MVSLTACVRGCRPACVAEQQEMTALFVDYLSCKSKKIGGARKCRQARGDGALLGLHIAWFVQATFVAAAPVAEGACFGFPALQRLGERGPQASQTGVSADQIVQPCRSSGIWRVRLCVRGRAGPHLGKIKMKS